MSNEQMLMGKLAESINESITQDRIVSVEVDDIEEAIAALNASWDGEIDYRENLEYGDGRRFADVWGWDDGTPKNEQEWRLYLLPATE